MTSNKRNPANPLTPLEMLIVQTFKAKGGFFGLDDSGHLHAVVGDRHCQLYCPKVSAAPFLVFDQHTMTHTDARVILGALVKTAKLEKAAGSLQQLPCWPNGVVKTAS